MQLTIARNGAYLLFLGAGVYACSSTTVTQGTGSGADSGAATPIADTSDSGTDSGPMDSGKTTTTDEACKQEVSAQSCQDCCKSNHKAGYDALEAALLACTCSDAVCKAVCSTTVCNTPPRDSDTKECRDCFSGALIATDGGVPPCAADVNKVLSSNPAAAAWSQCNKTQCKGKK